jgi:prevent-host-death family protein
VSSSHEPFAALGVADAKRRFSELSDRVERGETFIVARRGRPIVALVPPATLAARQAGAPAPIGLAAAAGALADWNEMDSDMAAVVEARSEAADRPPPDLG